jgi:hypothetical protein
MMSILTQPAPTPRLPRCAPSPQCVHLADFHKTPAATNSGSLASMRPFALDVSSTFAPRHSISHPTTSRQR